MVDKKPKGSWEGGVGYLTPEIAKAKLPKPSDDNLILVCGPPPMVKAISGPKKSPKDQGTPVIILTSEMEKRPFSKGLQTDKLHEKSVDSL